ncbi:aminotransferase class III-fold pyridoxal phosphate-dependent enzyme [Streptomyces carpaticus]|uniref:Aminotransferase class III-fold pyridoxal phosphate-dependent enzyme n=1 Tax=Streptomyces carpaticus TaxID=285558 RepID=A0ABV4ZU47_9ACTN
MIANPSLSTASSAEHLAAAATHGAPTHDPLPVVIGSARGAWVTDVEGRRYLDLLAGSPATAFGHRHPRPVAEARAQLNRLTVTSRAVHHEHFGALCAALAALCGMEMALPVTTGEEAVRAAVAAARAWGHRVKGVPAGRTRVVVASGYLPEDDAVSAGTGAHPPGCTVVPYGDLAAVAAALDAYAGETVAVLLEPVGGEAGVRVPPPGYLPGVRELTRSHGVLFLADERWSGLGRTGATFACEHEHVAPDLYVLGTALGGGVLPVAAVVSSAAVLGALRPGEYPPASGGGPLACAVALEVLAMLREGEPQRRARERGEQLHHELAGWVGAGAVREVRGRGLWAGVDIDPALGTGREIAERLMRRGVLVKDTHGSTIRIAPPLVISAEDLDLALEQLRSELVPAGTDRG